ncbi:MAG: DUF4976 domain-containing protein, partial [Cyclobacteriaceae bacterium]|nr:DUF4976 domain-containing protein [Cyclobacteriaceae bacterium]
ADYKLIHYYYVEDEWELIDRKKDPMELKNVYNDPAYAEIREDLHRRLEELRVKYKDNSALSQKYIDQLLSDAEAGKVYGIDSAKVQAVKARRREVENR